MKREKGFTLVELLVVIAVIALLMSILMPVLRKARDQAMRIICGTHQKNVVLGITMEADSSNNMVMDGGNGNLVSSTNLSDISDSYKIMISNKIMNGGNGNWPWDVPFTNIYRMLKYMGTDVSALSNVRNMYDIPLAYSENFYCPANTPQKRARLTNFHFTGDFCVASFFYTWKARWNNDGKAPITGFGPGPQLIGDATKPDPSKIWIDRLDIPQASSRELVIDATISQTGSSNDPYYDPAKYPLGNFAMITCGGNPGNGIPDSTNHLISDMKVAGGNMGFLDGHVEFRPWSEMRIRWNAIGGCPKWWW